MASATPTVVSDTGGLGEIVEDRKDGLKVAPGDARGLARAIDKILDNPGFAALLAAQGKDKTVRQYTWDVVVGNTLGLYKQLHMTHVSKEVLAVAP